MLKRKEKNNKESKGQLFIVGSFFILLSISIVSINLFTDYINKQKEKNLIKQYYETEEYVVDIPVMEEEIVQEEQQVEEKKEEKKVEVNYIAVIKIPKIGLEKGLQLINSIEDVYATFIGSDGTLYFSEGFIEEIPTRTE